LIDEETRECQLCAIYRGIEVIYVTRNYMVSSDASSVQYIIYMAYVTLS